VESKIKRMTATDPCICKSGLAWKKCCGRYLDNTNGVAGTYSVTGKEPVRFFLADLPTNEAYTDHDGTVLIFTNRAQALGLNERLRHKYQIIGMAEEKWAQFQKDVPNHLVISDAVA